LDYYVGFSDDWFSHDEVTVIKMGKVAVIGLGLTGKSAIDYLKGSGESVIALDTRASPSGVDELQVKYPDMPIHLGSLDALLTESVDSLVISPGVSLDEPVLCRMREKQIPIFSDIDLFLKKNTAPVIAITGSNGKTTVTTWVGECLKALGYRVNVCGNIGIPVLSRIEEEVDFVVMELSSFQLDASHDIQAEIAVCLNISPDHLDRHGSLENYTAAKMHIYRGAKIAIVNNEQAGYQYRGVAGQRVVPILELPDESGKSRLHRVNAAAVVTILVAAGISKMDAIRVIGQCRGLPHRFESVGSVNGVTYINDSKATNVGAAISAMQAAKDQAKKVILIAGGQTKSAPLDEWATVVKESVASVFLYGADALLMELALQKVGKNSVLVRDLKEAVEKAYKEAQFGDIVLLAPAAASLDMFSSYEQRGDVFAQCVSSLR
jgi:UDP-N-acetylmuramoylalanine--D-glutamate ligase